jgi:DNA-binding CsgD family transcriptional regulator
VAAPGVTCFHTGAVSSVLVGRDVELAALLAACHEGPGRLVLVTGEAGSGKTRLLTELATRTADAGALVGSGHAVAGGGPFRALAEALVRIAPPALGAEEGLAPFRPVLARILPTWPAGPDAAAHVVDPVVVLGEALLELLRVLAVGRRCVLLLDDLHWADPDTLAVLEYLGAGLSSLSVTVVAAARDDEAVSDGLAALGRHAQVRAVRLRRLADTDAALLARRSAGAELPAGVQEYLVGAADGLPLLVEELVAGLIESGALTRVGSRWETSASGAVPRAFSTIVDRRVDGLPSVAREVVQTAAVLGHDVDWPLLASATGLGGTALAEALQAAVDAGLLVQERGGSLRWRHALTRDAVFAGLLAPRRTALAARAAAGLEREPRAGRALVAELHARGGQPARAAALMLQEAREAVASGALATARGVLERAVVLSAGDPQLLVAIAVERVEVFALEGRTDDAVAVAEAVLPMVSGVDRIALVVPVARACVAAGRFDQARGYLAAVDRDDPRVRALSAHIALGSGDLDGALTVAAAAVEAAEEAGLPEVVCESLEVVGRSLRRRDPAASDAAFSRAEQVARLHGLVPWRIRALAELGAGDIFGTGGGDRLRQARDLAIDAGMLGTATGLDLQDVALSSGIDGVVATTAPAKRCAERAGRLGLAGIRAHALMLMARGRVYADRTAEAEALLDEAERLAPGPLYRSMRFQNRALDAWLRGDQQRATREMDACIALMRNLPAAPPAPLWGEWLLQRTVLDPADDAPRTEIRGSDVLVQQANRAALCYADAVAAGITGDSPTAGHLLAVGDQLLMSRPFLRYMMRIMLVPRAADAGLGDPTPLLREALAWMHTHDEVRMARLCVLHLRHLGAPIPRPGRDTQTVPPRLRALGVTSRESQVLLMIADGLTNPEIAERLHISRRTVETHVSNLLAKTGATARDGLAGRAGSVRHPL